MRFLLLPLSWLYGAITWLRNRLYDRGFLSTYRSTLFTIVIGNLQAGGSGKTPMTAYLFRLLSGSRRVAILSRGYGRKSRGLIEAGPGSDSAQIGDEPLWYYQTLPGAKVVVSEKRKSGLEYLEKQAVDLVLLDDALQHRAITGDLQILLSDYHSPYFSDYPLPFGRMREYRRGDKRADIIIISKCPPALSLQEKIEIIHKIGPAEHQEVFFTALEAGLPFPLKGNASLEQVAFSGITALSGIAVPDSFVRLCSRWSGEVHPLSYPDHHRYRAAEIRSLLAELPEDRLVFTTEKDAVKLREPEIWACLPENRFFVLPVQPVFLFGDEERFRALLKRAMLQKNKRIHP